MLTIVTLWYYRNYKIETFNILHSLLTILNDNKFELLFKKKLQIYKLVAHIIKYKHIVGQKCS